MAQKVIEQTNKHGIWSWEAVDWKTHEHHVQRIQERIFCETRDKNWGKVRNLQKLLVQSRSARLVAVKRVTQENKGRYTAGVDGLTYTTAAARARLADELSKLDPRRYECSPVRRVYIPKHDDAWRPLGIPTIKDRVMQMIVKMALEPEWEARFEPNSYGYRPGRGCHDALQQAWINMMRAKRNVGSSWILDADIAGCFDNIDHEALLERIPVFRQIIRRWLKAGVVEFGDWYETLSGTPQGGVISPLLANIALDGIERVFGMETLAGTYASPANRRGKNRGIGVVRYADDFIITAPSRRILESHVLPCLRDFLAARGLKLRDAKTRIVHVTDGCDFLGCTIRRFDHGNKMACLVKPSKDAVKRFLIHVKEILDMNKQVKVEDIITKLNPVILGWCNYYKYTNAKNIFGYVDHRIW